MPEPNLTFDSYGMSYKQMPSYSGAPDRLNLEEQRSLSIEPQSAVSVTGISSPDQQRSMLTPQVLAV